MRELLFHLALGNLYGKAAAGVSIKNGFEQLHFHIFVENNVKMQLFVASAAIAECR
jgi:hypothetical protein